MKNEKLNILVINRWVGYNQGGNETHIKELAYFLSKRGHKVSIVTTGSKALNALRPYLHKTYSVSSKQSYYSLDKNVFAGFINSLLFLFKSLLLIAKISRKEKIDVISVHFSLEAFLARFLRFFYGLPYVLVLVGDTDFELLEGKFADVTVQISNFMANESIKFGYKPRVLTKGVDRKRFNVRVPRSLRNKLLKNPAKEQIVLTVCRLDPRKNLETLIRAAEITKKLDSSIKYVIVGDGTEKIKLTKLIEELNLEDTVNMVGSIPSTSPLLPRFYRAADIFAMPTLYEGFGYVFSEAMATGLPIIATRTSAVPEVVAGTGILIPIKNPKLLASRILTIASNPKIKASMIKKGLKKVENWYWDRLIEDYEKAYYEAKNVKMNLSNRTNIFLKSLASTGFLISKTASLIFNTKRLSWGPSKSD